jgi:hypothetical protein
LYKFCLFLNINALKAFSLFSAIFLLLVFLPQCKDKLPEPRPFVETMPPATQEGKNTFGCYVNGELWVPRMNVENPNPYSPGRKPWASYNFDRNGGTFSVGARRYNDDKNIRQFIGISINKDFKGVGEYQLNSNLRMRDDGGIGRLIDYIADVEFTTDSILTGKLIITKLDTSAGIISGLFSFSAKGRYRGPDPDHPRHCDTIHVTDGRFDIRWPVK